MAALRRRRPSLLPEESGLQGKQEASVLKGKQKIAGASDAWSLPKKPARRNRGSRIVDGVAPSTMMGESDGTTEESSGKNEIAGKGMNSSSGRDESCRAVPVSSKNSVGSGSCLKQSKVAMPNPFAALDDDSMAGGHSNLKESNPGPLKRARPEESAVPRVAPKTRKGKGKQSGKRLMQSASKPPGPVIEIHGSVTFGGVDPKATADPMARVDGTQRMMVEGMAHDTVVSILKEAIQPKAIGDVMITQDQHFMADGSHEGCLPSNVRLGDGGGSSTSG